MIQLMFSRRWWWTTLIVIAGIALTVRLGIWQLDRHAQRQSRVEHTRAMLSLPPLDLNQAPLPADLDQMEYRQVVAVGEYDFEHQVALRNQVRSRLTGSDPGYALVTPLLLPSGQAVLVQRGWIPLDDSTPFEWRQYDEPGPVRIEGVLRLSLQQGEFGSSLVDPTLSSGQSRLDYWNFINLPRIQAQIPYPILDVYIQQAPSAADTFLPYRQLDPPDLDPGAHIGFALQWFFYACLLLFGYPVWLRRQDKKALP